MGKGTQPWCQWGCQPACCVLSSKHYLCNIVWHVLIIINCLWHVLTSCRWHSAICGHDVHWPQRWKLRSLLYFPSLQLRLRRQYEQSAQPSRGEEGTTPRLSVTSPGAPATDSDRGGPHGGGERPRGGGRGPNGQSDASRLAGPAQRRGRGGARGGGRGGAGRGPVRPTVVGLGSVVARPCPAWPGVNGRDQAGQPTGGGEAPAVGGTDGPRS
jgi:hypothetical protein